jgi:solute carrier family 25 phosphate transporter 3
LDQEEQYQKQKRKMEKRLNNRIKVSIATLSVFTAFFLLVVLSGPGQWRYYLAGGICAAVSHAVTTPVDVIKTRKQVDDSMKDMGLIQSGYKIIKDDKEGGINALLAGLGPTTIGYLFEGAVKFGVYEVFKPIIQSFLQRASIIFNIGWFDSKIIGFVLSGSLAGFAASIMLCPMEALRIRMVAEPEFAATGNCVECGIEMINNEGIMGLWKCLPSMLFKQVPYTVTKNVSFDLITTFAYGTVAELGRNICGRTKFIIPLVSAMIASVLSCISSQPGDMLLSVINAHKGKLTNRDHVRNIMKENGIGGFFIGIRERFVHVGLIVTVQLLIYDFVKRLVGITATGL